MNRKRLSLSGAVGALAIAAGVAFAQTPPGALAGGPWYDPNQLPATKGTVERFTLTPRGDIDGLILSDGTEIHVPPHLSTQIAATVKPGDTVTVHGIRAAAAPVVQASSITDEANGRTVTDNGPPDGPREAAAPPQDVAGTVRMALHGPRGEINGALLDDGTILRLPPPETARFATLLAPGSAIAAKGRIVDTSIGRVMAVQAFGPSPTQLSEVAPPPPPPGTGPGRHADRRPPRP